MSDVLGSTYSVNVIYTRGVDGVKFTKVFCVESTSHLLCYTAVKVSNRLLSK